MITSIAFYKGPPDKSKPLRVFSHYLVRMWTWSKYSHAELVIGDYCYSSSLRDGGVRKKLIDLDSGKWDTVNITLSNDQVRYALDWFDLHEGDKYDYKGIIRFIIPFVPHSKNKWFCFEAIGAALNFAGSHKLTANDLYKWALNN